MTGKVAQVLDQASIGFRLRPHHANANIGAGSAPADRPGCAAASRIGIGLQPAAFGTAQDYQRGRIDVVRDIGLLKNEILLPVAIVYGAVLRFGAPRLDQRSLMGKAERAYFAK